MTELRVTSTGPSTSHWSKHVFVKESSLETLAGRETKLSTEMVLHEVCLSRCILNKPGSTLDQYHKYQTEIHMIIITDSSRSVGVLWVQIYLFPIILGSFIAIPVGLLSCRFIRYARVFLLLKLFQRGVDHLYLVLAEFWGVCGADESCDTQKCF